MVHRVLGVDECVSDDQRDPDDERGPDGGGARGRSRARCGRQGPPSPRTRRTTTTPPPIPRTATAPHTTTSRTTTDKPPGGGVFFGSCRDARAAGAAPLHVGEPGYRRGLDWDGDGVACERR